MDIFSIITLIGGLAFFLYGMNTLSAGLERMTGGKLEGALKKITSSKFKSLLLGIGITAAIQSSSAVTVMLVGLVNSGIMTIGQSTSVIMGSNIGTTLTAWILTLVGVESGNVWIKLLKPENFSLVFAFVGILLIMGSKRTRKKDIGSILVGFAVLMYGMKLMSGAVKPLADMPSFTRLLTAFQNPILGVLVGALITAIIQSSSASVGILQALALTGSIRIGAAIPIIMGQNIGTCITSLISSIGVSKNAKKVAVVHVAFNLIGTTLCLSIYCLADSIFHFRFSDMPIDAVGIAVVHTTFNLITTAILFPFSSLLEKLANRILPEQENIQSELLDTRLMTTPSVAIAECNTLTNKMSAVAKDSLISAISLLNSFSQKEADDILEKENILDTYEDKLGTYLVQLSSKRLSETDSLKVSKMLHSIGDFERIGDHAVNIMASAQELNEKQLQFSPIARKELEILIAASLEILELSHKAYETGDIAVAARVEPLEQTIDSIVDVIKARHIQRLQAGACSVELGFILSDLLNNFERISDHCSNIAVAIIELTHHSFDTHKYLKDLRSTDAQFKDTYTQYVQKYNLSNLE